MNNERHPTSKGLFNGASGCLLLVQGLVLGILLSLAAVKFLWPNQHETTVSSQVVIEQIKDVAKLVTVEGSFSEIYSYEDSYKMFYNFLEFEKKAITTVNAKAWISYDLNQIEFEVEEANKVIRLTHIPDPEILIEPDFRYYDIEESVLNTFTKEDYNKIYEQSIQTLRKKIQESDLEERAQQNVVERIRSMQLLSGANGWDVVDVTSSIPSVNWKTIEAPFRNSFLQSQQ